MVIENSKHESWNFKQLNEYLELLTDYDSNGSFADIAANVHTEWGHGYAWYVRATDLEQNLSMSDVRYADEYSYHFLKKTPLFGGELLMAKRGEIGKIYFFKKRSKYATLAPNLYLLKLNDGMDTKFLYYYFMSSEGQKKIKSINASTSLGAIYKDDVKKILVPELDVKEQRRIAETLSDIDYLCTDLQKIIKKKKYIRQGTMQMLVSGKKRLIGFEGDWRTTTLDKLCRLVTKQTGFDYSAEIKPSLVSESQIGTIPFIQNKDFESFDINYNTDFYIPCAVAEKYPKILLDEVCLLISISGRIGNVAVFDNKQTAFAGGAVGIAKLFDPDLVSWCMLYLSGRDGQKQIFSNEKVGAQHNLTVADVRKLEIRLPEKSEREAIISVLADMDNEINLLVEKLHKYEKVKKGMMEELLTGKIRLI